MLANTWGLIPSFANMKALAMGEGHTTKAS